MESLGKHEFGLLIDLTYAAIAGVKVSDLEGHQALLLDLLVMYEETFDEIHAVDARLPDLQSMIDSKEEILGQMLTNVK